MFQAHPETVDEVKDWIKSAGILENNIQLSRDKGWLEFSATTHQAEKMLHTEFYDFEHTTTGHTATACDEYHLPKYIQGHIDYVEPGVTLLAPRKRGTPLEKRTEHPHRRVKTVEAPDLAPGKFVHDLTTCDVSISPQCVQALYKFPNGTKADASNAMGTLSWTLVAQHLLTLVQGIYEEGDFYDQADLNKFYANFTPYIPKGNHPVLHGIDGAKAPVSVKNAGGESVLDFELAIPILYPQKTYLFQTDDSYYANQQVYDALFNTFLDALDESYCTYSAFNETGDDPSIDPTYPDKHKNGFKNATQCGVYKPTNVISVSYGEQEGDLPVNYQKRQCNEWMKLGLQGVSVFFASGDDGVAGPPGDETPSGCLGKNHKKFSPAFPNTCPYITNVGATKVYPGHSVNETQPESAAYDPAGHPYQRAFASGGGFSNIYPVPSYQQAAVSAFLSNHTPPYKSYPGPGNASFGQDGGIYNRDGRAYPDVSANGDNIATYTNGVFGLSGGTSASTPIFASIINRINEERIAAGKKPVGFVNPVLYKNPSALNDVVNGTNPGCGTKGFSAVEGWDPATGLGTPNYPKLLDVFMALP